MLQLSLDQDWRARVVEQVEQAAMWALVAVVPQAHHHLVAR